MEKLHIHTPHATNPERPAPPAVRDARNHYPQIKHHTPPPKWGDNQVPRTAVRAPPNLKPGDTGLLSQSPIVCSMIPPPARSLDPRPTETACRAPEPNPLQASAHPTNRSAHRTPAICGRGMSLVVLLRKEVIQPHLPVRLPCYDFVPIADPTFDGSLHKG